MISTNYFNAFSALSAIEIEAVAVFPSHEYLFHVWDTCLCFVCPQWIVFVLMSTTLSWIILVVLFTYCLFKFRLTRIHSYLTTIKLRLSFKVFLLKEQFLALFVSVLIKTISVARKMYDVIIFMIHCFSKNWVNFLYWLTWLTGRFWLTGTWLTGSFFSRIISYQVK